MDILNEIIFGLIVIVFMIYENVYVCGCFYKLVFGDIFKFGKFLMVMFV